MSYFRPVQFSNSVVSDSWLVTHGLQHAGLPCPSPTPRAYSNSCLLSRWCHPTISSSVIPFSSRLQSFPASGPVLCIRWPKCWSFSFKISPSNEHSGLISFRLYWLDLLAVPGILKDLLQHHSSKASVLQHSGFFIIQLSHPYMTTGKTIALTRQTFIGKVMSLLLTCCSERPHLCSRPQLTHASAKDSWTLKAVTPEETDPDLPVNVLYKGHNQWFSVLCS